MLPAKVAIKSQGGVIGFALDYLKVYFELSVVFTSHYLFIIFYSYLNFKRNAIRIEISSETSMVPFRKRLEVL